MTNDPKREAVARIIDPAAWCLVDHWRKPDIARDRPDLESRIPAKIEPSLTKADAILALGSAGGEMPRLPRDKLLYGHPDYIDDPEGLERWRQSAKEGHGHDMAPININSLRRLIDTIERLRAALSTPKPAEPAVEAEWIKAPLPVGVKDTPEIREKVQRALSTTPAVEALREALVKLADDEDRKADMFFKEGRPWRACRYAACVLRSAALTPADAGSGGEG